MNSKSVTAPRLRRNPHRKDLRRSTKSGAPRLKFDGRPRAVMVLGMHRSGTSAFASVLGLLGADLPKSLLPPSETNENGYWESRELVAIHDELLSTGGSKWDDWRAFNPEWYQSSVAGTYKSRILDVLRKDFANSRLFAVKDPRNLSPLAALA